MRKLSGVGQQALEEIAHQHGFSTAAVSSMLDSISRGGGGMAQFNHEEFGGAGQWMRGGMTMVSDMFNADLKDRVGRLCDALSRLMATSGNFEAADSRRARDHSVPRRSGTDSGRVAHVDQESAKVGGASSSFDDWSDDWWPTDLGQPSATGSQNDVRYAYFAQARRLAIDIHGRVTVYDTGSHHIGGVAQQQSSDFSLKFTSQHGLVDVSSLPVVWTSKKA